MKQTELSIYNKNSKSREKARKLKGAFREEQGGGMPPQWPQRMVTTVDNIAIHRQETLYWMLNW